MTKRTLNRTLAFLVVAALAGFFAAGVLASPGTHQYDNPVKHERAPTVVQTPPNGGGGTGSVSLPFTGLEIGLIVAGGCGAAGAGFVLRRATRGNRA